MNAQNPHDLSRRDFVKASAITAGAVMLSKADRIAFAAEATSSGELPVANVLVTVKQFADGHTSAVIDHAVRVLTPLPGVWQYSAEFPNDWIHVAYPGAILRFTIDSTDGQVYRPLGITFSPADILPALTLPQSLTKRNPDPGAVDDFAAALATNDEWKARNAGGAKFPFSGMQVAGATIQVVDRIVHDPAPPNSRIYKFSIVIQRLSDGAIGIIDPEVENETPA